MNFDISEEQELLQDTVRQYLEGRCPIGKVREIFDGESGFDSDVWRGMIELGLGGIALPDE